VRNRDLNLKNQTPPGEKKGVSLGCSRHRDNPPTLTANLCEARPVDLRVVDHPLVSHKLSLLRAASTDSVIFRQLVEELVTLLAYEVTRSVRVEPCTVSTPVAETVGVRLARPRPLVVPILRAGLGMLEGMSRLMPTAEVGFVGMVRDDTTLEPFTYAERLPQDLSGRQCYVLDPMLATGGSLGGTVQFLRDRGAHEITAVCLIAAPEGIEHIDMLTRDLDVPFTLVVGAVDDHLNEHGYIVPGLGDAGDRLYGLAQ
jgi:uracil phosphoribosyltransferase